MISDEAFLNSLDVASVSRTLKGTGRRTEVFKRHFTLTGTARGRQGLSI